MTPTRPTRQRRGRVVLVGDPGTLDVTGNGRPLTVTADVFAAIGEVTIATAANPVAAVFIRAEHADPETPGAIRRIDPAVEVFLIDSGTPTPSLAEHYDGVLPPPHSLDTLERALAGEFGPARTSPPPETPPETLPETLPETPPAPDPESPAATTGRPAPRHLRGEQLGDTDLIDTVLGDEDVTPRLLEMVIEQTGWEDVGIATREPGEGGQAVEITFGERSFGWLHTRRGTVETIEPWAAWVARWLEMDRALRTHRMLAYHDDLTAAGNRRFYRKFMDQAIAAAARQRRAVTVMVFDIDDFKRFNDEFGHDAGDEILIETVRLLQSVIRAGDRVCRIGGDEFAVVFADPEGPRELGSRHPQSVETIVERFRQQILAMKFPKLGLDAPGNLTMSAGLATYPWDGRTPDELLHHADTLAIESKRHGKNSINFGTLDTPDR